MALRPLDNALPISQERPKKQAKIVIPADKVAEINGVNDENKVPFAQQSTADATIDYIPSQNLKEIQDPDVKIQGLIGGLESKDWLKVCESLNDVRRFALYHSSLLLPILEKVVIIMVKSMKNPRSALCKTSIMACSDILKAFGEKLLESITCDAFNQLLLQLLLKASQDKKFVCEEAEKALKVMVESITPLPLLLHKLGASVGHSNLKIRAKAGICISNCVSKMDAEGMKEFGLVGLLQIGTNLLNDKLPEAREAARSILLSLYEAVVISNENENEEEKKKVEAWQNFCQSNLSPIHALAVVKLVSSS
ncbi:hypothetical protein ACJIZ3_018179 [Penstemon smallii]|uniref:TOG domain-containing protein n=1 Tax=Penstemon smallii TaxID=265156 RepID=A0ABD3SXQ6_9LAMI